MNSKPTTEVIEAGAAFLVEHSDRARILGDYEIARASAIRDGHPMPSVAAAALTILRHGLAPELGLDYGEAAEGFLSAIALRQWALQIILSEEALEILAALQSETESASVPGAVMEPSAILQTVLAAYLAAVAPENPLAADFVEGGAEDAAAGRDEAAQAERGEDESAGKEGGAEGAGSDDGTAGRAATAITLTFSLR
jgi:hypothetical protein